MEGGRLSARTPSAPNGLRQREAIGFLRPASHPPLGALVSRPQEEARGELDKANLEGCPRLFGAAFHAARKADAKCSHRCSTQARRRSSRQ
jgi:hypothetical protein